MNSKYFFSHKQEWPISFLAAVLLHVLLFFGTGFAFVQSAQYGVEASSGGIEVSLVAALPESTQKNSSSSIVKDEVTEEQENQIVEDAPKEIKTESAQSEPKENKNNSVVNNTPFVGDGSSSAPGQSHTTFYSPGGGSASERAGYLKNPPPPYPSAAIERGQEGVVLLSVHIDQTGQAEKVEIKKSSGHHLLDESALRTVRKWKFDPAHIGFFKTDSQIDIPIRFVLKDELKRMRS